MDWVREQVDTYEATNGRDANTLRETGIPIIVVTTKGASSGNVRKFALSSHSTPHSSRRSAAPRRTRPGTTISLPNRWAHVLRQHAVLVVAVVEGDDRQAWWDRAVEVFPTYAQYAEKTDRTIPVFVARPH